MMTRKCIYCLFVCISNRRQGYLDQVRSYSETPDESFGLECEGTFSISGDDPRDDSVRELRREVESLKTQVKCLKRIAMLNVFESKRDFFDFFDDIW